MIQWWSNRYSGRESISCFDLGYNWVETFSNSKWGLQIVPALFIDRRTPSSGRFENCLDFYRRNSPLCFYWIMHYAINFLNPLKKSCGCKAGQTEKDGCNKHSNQCKSSCKSRIESYGFANAVTKVGKEKVKIWQVIVHWFTQPRQVTLHRKVDHRLGRC